MVVEIAINVIARVHFEFFSFPFDSVHPCHFSIFFKGTYLDKHHKVVSRKHIMTSTSKEQMC